MCEHSACPSFFGYAKISGKGPAFINVHSGGQWAYGCFKRADGADCGGANFYGPHTLKIEQL